MTSLFHSRLYTIIDTGYLSGRDPAQIAREMVDGGADIIQLRAKRDARANCADGRGNSRRHAGGGNPPHHQ